MNIVYTGFFSYPDSNANSLRVHGMVDMLKTLGHNIKVIPGIQSQESVDKNIDIIQIDEYKSGLFSGINGLRGMFVGDNTIHYLESLQEKPDIIILYGTHLSYLTRLIKYTKKYGVKLILDVVEWYDPRHLPGGIFGPFAFMNELSMRHFVKQADGLIVISEYLKKYYTNKGCKLILLPPIFPEQKKSIVNKFSNSVIHLCYVGTPGKKEDFLSLCESLENIYNDNIQFYMHFVGFTKQQLLMNEKFKKYSFINNKKVCSFYGRLTNEEAKKIISKSHFSIFFRPNLRFANAGFPSKLAESFSLGTAVICNDISDVKKYVSNEYNGFILKSEFDNADLYQLLKKVFLSKNQEYLYMKNSVKRSYLQFFNKESYLHTMHCFFDKV